MLSGRHFLLLGVIACCGLLSVHDGQRQIELCYDIAKIEKDLRGIRDEIQLGKIKHMSLQSPKAVMERAEQLKLKVQPVLPPSSTPPTPPAPRAEPPRSLGQALPATRNVPAPGAPAQNGRTR